MKKLPSPATAKYIIPIVFLAQLLAFLAVATITGSSLVTATEELAEAFPGAVGYGRLAQGGRKGRIDFVTNLNDRGPGSLRNCVEASGPRTCVFRAGGVIELESPLGIEREGSNLSILGQSAPSPGITLTIASSNNSHIKTPLYMRNTTDVVIRHLKIRLQYPSPVKNADAVTIENSKRIYLDHISGIWATDEGISTHGNATDITIANSIFAEGLKPHSKCALLGSDPTGPQNITFWQNACLSNNDRNPDVNHFAKSCVEIVNNLFYNARSEWVEVFAQFPGGTPVAIVGNYFKAGKSTTRETSAIKWQAEGAKATPKIYAINNATWAPGSKKIREFSLEALATIQKKPACPLSPSLPVSSPNEAYKNVRLGAGAFPRDEIDLRLMRDLGERGKEGRGSIPSSPGEVAKPSASGTPYVDADSDGIADSMENKLGTIAGVYDPWTKRQATGKFAFDQFMEWLAQERLDGREPM